MVFLDADKGWISGDGGRIRYTTNGGTDWLTADLDEDPGVPVRVQLRGMHFLSADEAWAVGDGGVILRSKSTPAGSKEWEDINSSNRITNQVGSGQDPCVLANEPADLYDIFMVTDQVGWVVGTKGTVCKTTDGWETWSQSETIGGEYMCYEDPHDLYDIHFFADSDSGEDEDPYSKGIILGEYGTGLATDDAGETWTGVGMFEATCPQLSHQNVEMWEISFEDPLDWESPAWVAGGFSTGQGYFVHWTGGENGSWVQYRCYQFLNPENQDGLCGMSTQYACAVLDAEASPVRVITGGYGGELYVHEVGDTNYDPCNCSYELEEGETYDPECDPDEAAFVQKDNVVDAENPLVLRPPLLAAARLNDTQGIVVGDFGRVTRYVQGVSPGEITELGTPYVSRLFDGEFLTETTGCVAGQGQVIFKTTDGGNDWAVVDLDWTPSLSNQILAIDFSTSGDFGVAVGSGGFIARTTEDAENPDPEDVVAAWTNDVSKPPHFGPEVRAVAFVPNSPRVFAVTAAGDVIRSGTNGATWATMTAPPAGVLNGVAFATNSTGYVVGDDAAVYQTTNGGLSWSPVSVNCADGEDFKDVETWGDGTEAILVAAGGGVFVKTSTAFNKLDSGDFGFDEPTKNLNDVEVLDAGDTIRIGGDNGIALFYDEGIGWSQPRTSVGSPLFKLAFQSADHGFAIGLNFVIAEFTAD